MALGRAGKASQQHTLASARTRILDATFTRLPYPAKLTPSIGHGFLSATADRLSDPAAAMQPPNYEIY